MEYHWHSNGIPVVFSAMPAEFTGGKASGIPVEFPMVFHLNTNDFVQLNTGRFYHRYASGIPVEYHWNTSVFFH